MPIDSRIDLQMVRILLSSGPSTSSSVDCVMREPANESTPALTTGDDSDGPQDLGLLVLLSTTQAVLHANGQARALLERLRLLQTPVERGTSGASGLPISVRGVCEEAQRTLSDRSEQNDWQPFEVSRVVGSADDSMLVRAFVFPSRASLTQTRILVTLQPL